MLFNSLDFLLFFPIVTLLYFLIPHPYRWLHLLVASCVFYMSFIPVYILILLFTIVIDYIAGVLIENAEGRKKKFFLMASIFANVGVLAFFKYYNFFFTNVNSLLGMLHVTAHSFPLLAILLPIGLSFHTFQAMSYTLEVYRGHQKAERHFGIYSLYVMFYPQLVAGPIERPQNLLYQFREKHTFNGQNLQDGLRLMLWGFFKKMVIADKVSGYVNPIFDAPAQFHFLNLFIAACFFSIQIYCDFSGYSDIAIGTAKVMGFDLMVNFRRPLLSKKFTELWQRWHISLTTWFNNYLYTPFVTQKRDWGTRAIYIGVMMTFLVSGLWHGAAWKFVIFGAANGIGLVYEMVTKKTRKKLSKAIPAFIYHPLSIIFTFLYFTLCTIFFRANSVSDAFVIIGHIFTFSHSHPFLLEVTDFVARSAFGIVNLLIAVLLCLLLFICEGIFPVDFSNLRDRPLLDIFFCAGIFTLLIIFGVFDSSSFIYFQF